jgi:hypothetical protein
MNEAPRHKPILVYTSDFGPVIAWCSAGEWVTTWEMDGTQTLMCGMTPKAWAELPPKPSFARDPLFDDEGDLT